MPNKTLELTPCYYLENGTVLCEDATPVIQQAIENADKFKIPENSSPFYQWGDLVFAASTIYQAAREPFNSIMKELKAQKQTLPENLVNRFAVFTGLTNVTMEQHPLLYDKACAVNY